MSEKINVDSVVIDGATYVRADSVQTPDYSDSDVRIVVLQRSWNLVGYLRRDENNGEYVLESAKVIRRWGTKKGLGELAAKPLSQTILDDAGTVRFHEGALVFSIACSKDGWKDSL